MNPGKTGVLAGARSHLAGWLVLLALLSLGGCSNDSGTEFKAAEGTSDGVKSSKDFDPGSPQAKRRQSSGGRAAPPVSNQALRGQ